MEKINIGKNCYSNVLPVSFFFRDHLFEKKATFTEAVPAQLNALLARGEIDLGPVSAYTYAEHAGDYETLKGLSVSAKGPVGSIFLFSKLPLQELHGETISLTNTSATSVNLLKIILEKFEGIQPRYEVMPPSLPTMMENAKAALLIGDHAIKAKWNNSMYHVYDLGELWYKHTGMWMTFALWCVRKEAIRTKTTWLKEVHEEFLRSKERGMKEMAKIIEFVQRKIGGTSKFWQEYFLGLSHDFGQDQKQGLEYYFKCAAEMDLISHSMAVEVWG